MKTWKQKYYEAQDQLRSITEILDLTANALDKKELCSYEHSKNVREVQRVLLQLVEDSYMQASDAEELAMLGNLRAKLMFM